jgi:hypothetical protein
MTVQEFHLEVALEHQQRCAEQILQALAIQQRLLVSPHGNG